MDTRCHSFERSVFASVGLPFLWLWLEAVNRILTKKILSGLKGECQMALIVALANVVQSQGARMEEEPEDEQATWSFYLVTILAILSLVREVVKGGINWLKYEFNKRTTKPKDGGAEPNQRPKMLSSVPVCNTETVCHTNPKCQHYGRRRKLSHS